MPQSGSGNKAKMQKNMYITIFVNKKKSNSVWSGTENWVVLGQECEKMTLNCIPLIELDNRHSFLIQEEKTFLSKSDL